MLQLQVKFCWPSLTHFQMQNPYINIYLDTQPCFQLLNQINVINLVMILNLLKNDQIRRFFKTEYQFRLISQYAMLSFLFFSQVQHEIA